MIYPSIDQLFKQVDSKYTLVIMAAKRGRQIRNGNKPMVECDSRKEVSIALHEIVSGEVTYERIRSGMK